MIFFSKAVLYKIDQWPKIHKAQLKKKSLKVWFCNFHQIQPTYSDPRVTYSYPKVTYNDPKVIYSDPEVTYSNPTHLPLPPPASHEPYQAISFKAFHLSPTLSSLPNLTWDHN